tara:strand:- start:606 stop:1613 length:1008 start_codon:yes stop_codon:yes gene_type:complete
MLNNKLQIIAEVGVNHNGSIKIAKKLVKVAKNSGATFVKFQMFNAANHILKNTKLASYQMKNLSSKISQYEMAKKYEFSKKDFLIINNYCKKNKIFFLASVFDVKSFKSYLTFKNNFIKIPSGEITNFELLNEISKHKLKVFLSTGMSNLLEIKQAISLLKSKKKIKDIIVLQCTTEYPSNHNNANLNVLKTFQQKLKCSFGYSDHTLGYETSMLAVALGAKVLEKHITLNKNMKGPDHLASCNPIEFKNYVKAIKRSLSILGSNEKKTLLEEKKTLLLVRKSIVAKKKILKNEIFSKYNLTVKRPGDGVSSSNFLKLIGKKSKFNFEKDEKIKI